MSGARPFYPESALVDSSGTLAFVDIAETNHIAAAIIYDRLLMHHARLFTTNFLIDETYTLLLVRLGYRYAIDFLNAVVTGSTTIVSVTGSDEQRAQQILRSHSDKRFSCTDATCFAVMHRIGIQSVWTFDRNFSQYGQFIVLEP